MRSAPFPGSNPPRATPAQIERSKAIFAASDARAREKQMVPVSEAETTALMKMTREHGALDFEFGTGGVRVWIGPNCRWAFDHLLKMRTDEALALHAKATTQSEVG